MDNQKELIGNVIIDLSFYNEQDDHSNETIYDRLLNAIKAGDSSDDDLIRENKDWTTLYHLSPFRENIINWFPINKTDNVLEIGSECGAVTGSLCKKAYSVHSIDTSLKACQINALRHKECSNLSLSVGAYNSILSSIHDKYDIITVLDPSLWGIDLLVTLKDHLKPNGKILITANNKLGVRYLSGYEDDTKKYTHSELIDLIDTIGFSNYSFYYPYPDLILPTTIYSDEYLPQKGELIDNIRNFDKSRYVYWDESIIFDDILSEKEFSSFSNSFLIVLGNEGASRIVYAKLSDNRDKQYRIITSIINESGKLKVEKINRLPEGADWIKKVYDNETKISKVYENKARICKAVSYNDCLTYDYISGIRMDTMLSEACKHEDFTSICSVLDEYYKLIKYMQTGNSFMPSDSFIKVFGQRDIPEYTECGEIVNIDMVLSNIIQSEGTYHIIDCEWVFDFQIPLEFVFWRGLFYSREIATLEDSLKNQLFDHYGLSEEKRDMYVQMEVSFQFFVYGDSLRIQNYAELMPLNIVTTDTLNQKIASLEDDKASLNAEIARLDNQLNNIYNSKTWKILRFFKIVG